MLTHFIGRSDKRYIVGDSFNEREQALANKITCQEAQYVKRDKHHQYSQTGKTEAENPFNQFHCALINRVVKQAYGKKSECNRNDGKQTSEYIFFEMRDSGRRRAKS